MNERKIIDRKCFRDLTKEVGLTTLDLEAHGSNHVPGSLYHLLDCDMRHVRNLHERTYAHIGKTQLINFFVIGECPKVGFHNQ